MESVADKRERKVQKYPAMRRELRIGLLVGGAAALLSLATLAWTGSEAIPRWWTTNRQAARAKERMAIVPSVVLWAWERPEDLRPVANQKVGVAFLAATIAVWPGSTEPGGVQVRPRLQPLRVGGETPLIAVVRIETPAGNRAAFSDAAAEPSSRSGDAQAARIAGEIVRAANWPQVVAVQIDFDAGKSERGLYRALLLETRKRLPPETRLSITALASWCIGDRWLDDLPAGTIDEAVPMVFRMGPGGTQVANFLREGVEFPVVACLGSIGLSTDEKLSRDILANHFGDPHLFAHKRKYIFSPRSWTADTAKEMAGLSAASFKE